MRKGIRTGRGAARSAITLFALFALVALAMAVPGMRRRRES
ncbi:hypothetical protein [Actinomadura sp.]